MQIAFLFQIKKKRFSLEFFFEWRRQKSCKQKFSCQSSKYDHHILSHQVFLPFAELRFLPAVAFTNQVSVWCL